MATRWWAILFSVGLVGCVDTVVDVPETACDRDPARMLVDGRTWAWSRNELHPGYEQVMAPLAIVHVDPDATPDVVFTAFATGADRTEGALVALSGVDGQLLWSRRDLGEGVAPSGTSAVAVASYGMETRLAVGTREGLALVDPDGDLVRIVRIPIDARGIVRPTVGRPSPEVEPWFLVGGSIVTFEGTLLRRGELEDAAQRSTLVWFEAEAEPFLLVGGVAYALEESTDLERSVGSARGEGVHAEFSPGARGWIQVVDGTLHVHPPHRETWSRPLPGGGGGVPLALKIGDETSPSIAVASRNAVTVWTAEGALRWTRPIDDASSGVAGMVSLDVDGDGIPELIVGDERTVWLFSSRDGRVIASDPQHASGTLFEEPCIASLDDDPAAEVLVGASDYRGGERRGVVRYDLPVPCGTDVAFSL